MEGDTHRGVNTKPRLSCFGVFLTNKDCTLDSLTPKSCLTTFQLSIKSLNICICIQCPWRFYLSHHCHRLPLNSQAAHYSVRILWIHTSQHHSVKILIKMKGPSYVADKIALLLPETKQMLKLSCFLWGLIDASQIETAQKGQ